MDLVAGLAGGEWLILTRLQPSSSLLRRIPGGVDITLHGQGPKCPSWARCSQRQLLAHAAARSPLKGPTQTPVGASHLTSRWFLWGYKDRAGGPPRADLAVLVQCSLGGAMGDIFSEFFQQLWSLRVSTYSNGAWPTCSAMCCRPMTNGALVASLALLV